MENKKGLFVKDHTGLYQSESCVYDSTLLSVTQFPSEKRVIYSCDLKTNTSNSIEILGDKKKRISKSTIDAIQQFQNYIVLLGSDDIFVLERENSGAFKLIKTLKNDYSFRAMKTFGDKMLLYVNYNFHPLDAEHRHVWAYFNMETLSVEQVKIQPEENTRFSHFVNGWMDVYKDKIAFANTTEYRVRFYDRNFQVVDSIVSDELKGNGQYLAELKEIVTESKDAISQLMEKESTVLTRIRNVYFLNDSTILVLLKPAGDKDHNDLIADYWQRANGHWSKIKTDRSGFWFKEGQPYSAANITYYEFYRYTFDFPYLGDGNFCRVYYPYIPTVTTDKFDLNKDYLEKQNEAIRSKDTHFGIKIIHVSLPVAP